MECKLNMLYVCSVPLLSVKGIALEEEVAHF